MKNRLIAVSLVFTGLIAASSASAQVVVQLGAPAPTITFVTRPTLVVISPGIMVVEGYDDEVFFMNRYYWVRRGPVWYRTGSYNGTWVVAESRYVPQGLVRLPPGQYKNYRRADKRSAVGPQSSVVHRPDANGPRHEKRKGNGKGHKG